MNINLFTFNLNRRSKFITKISRARKLSFTHIISFVIAVIVTACSFTDKTTLQGNEILACSPGIQFLNHNVICEKEKRDNWVSCQMNGSIENNGTSRLINVIVTVEFGRELLGVRNSTFNFLGDFDPGEQANFSSNFQYFEPLSEYDIKVECGDSISTQPSPVPTPAIYFTSLWQKDDVTNLEIDPISPTTLYAGTETQGVFKSIDGGSNWVPSNTGLFNLRIVTLAIDPIQPTTLYAGSFGTDGTNGAAYKSIDKGENWLQISNGMDGAYITSILLDPLTPSTIYAGTSNGVFKSSNSGVEWTQLDTGSPDPYILEMVIDPLTPTNLYAVDFGTPNQGFIKSTNGGINWSDLNVGSWDTQILSLTIDPQTPTTLYAGTWVGAFKTTDAGENWNEINTGIGDYAIIDVLIVNPINPSTLYASKRDSDIYKSIDGGENWYPLHSNIGTNYIFTLSLDPENPEILYATTENGVFVLDQRP